MTQGESQRAARGRRTRGDVLWNAAAVAGLLLIGLLLGGVAGVVLDRQGLLGAVPQTVVIAAVPPQAPPREAPEPLPRIVAAAPEVDREALEVQYHEALRRQQAAAPLPEIPAVAALPPLSRLLPAPEGPPRWQQHAVVAPPPDGRPMIAIVLDDLGVNRRGARGAIALPAPLTLAFMTYAEGLPEMTAAARAAGHELMLHVPMQPVSEAMDPGPNVLSAALPRAELLQRLAWGLDRFEGYVGINNHMGSRFTASPEGMALVMGELKARGLLFLDSLTAGNSVAGALAAETGVPYAVRDVFLDNEPDDPLAIRRQLSLLEEAARQRGYAIGIGHPHDATLAALAEWIPQMQARGFALVPLSAVVRHREQIAAQQAAGG